MKKLVLIVLFHIIVLNIFALGIKEDKYIGFSENDLIDILGEKYTVTDKEIEWGYMGYEFEPDYSKYFSREELKDGVIIRMIIWRKCRRETIVWFKFVNEKWVCFNSLSYNIDWVKF